MVIGMWNWGKRSGRRQKGVSYSPTGVIKTVRQCAVHFIKMYNTRIGVEPGRDGWERPLLKGKAR